jgi:hypothetical protein
MSFLHPLLLWGLALAALPVVIHLLNQLRYRTVRWGAMMFLLSAQRMARGMARLRQWLILAMRMLAIACLVFVVGRPLAGGWLGLAAAGRVDTTLILLDRSPSMSARDSSAGRTKLSAGRQTLAAALSQLSSARWVLVDSAHVQPRELESPAALADLPEAGAASASADVPAMLEAAREYMSANQTGRTDIWLCSDLHANDWNADDARWSALRASFARLQQGVRLRLLALAAPASANLAVRVTRVRQRQTDDGAELLISLRISRSPADASQPVTVPLRFEIVGARSATNIELAGSEVDLADHRIALDATQPRGWGRVSLPADSNQADNDYYFVFDTTASSRAVVVSDERDTAEALRLAASISPDSGTARAAEVVPLAEAAEIEWDQTALVLWQAPLPDGEVARQLTDLIERGGQVMFFPPSQPTADELFGARWQSWTTFDDAVAAGSWRGDEDLLANTQAGAELAVREVGVRRACGLTGNLTVLARLPDGAALLARAATARGGVYFCATTPAARDSNLAEQGVVLYVMVQRALSAGSAALGAARDVVAGRVSADTADWQRLAGGAVALSTEYAAQAGAYAAGDTLIAVNRSAAEDRSGILADERVAALFAGLDFTRLDQRADSERSLIEEIWRPFLAAMVLALIAEAWLCLPRPVAA